MFDHKAFILVVIINISLIQYSVNISLGNSGLKTQNSVCIFFPNNQGINHTTNKTPHCFPAFSVLYLWILFDQFIH